MHKKLAVFLATLGVALTMAQQSALAASPKAKISRWAHSQNTRETRGHQYQQTHAKGSRAPNTSHMVADRFNCEMGKSFTLYRYQDNDSEVILDWGGKKQTMYRVESVTNAERFETDNQLTYIGASNLSQLIDFRSKKPILTECRNAEQRAVQYNLDQKETKRNTKKTNRYRM